MGQPRRLHLARQNRDQPRRVTFARRGVWEAGAHVSFFPLKVVRMTLQPPTLHFRTDRIVGEDESGWSLRVLVPRGHEAEATQLVQRYQAMIEEQRSSQARLSNPPEPR